MTVSSFLEDVASGIGKLGRAEKQMRRRPAASRPAPSRPAVSPARALGLDGSSPFRRPQQQARRRTQRAVEQLPNPPRLLQVPILKTYTSAERDLILAEQGRRLVALSNATGLSADDLRSALPADDRRQLDLFVRLAAERAGKIAHDVAGVPRNRAYPARPDGAIEGIWRGATVTAPMALLGHDFQSRFAEIGGAGQAAASLAKPTWSDATHLVIDAVPSMYETGKAGLGVLKYAVTATPGNTAHDSADLEPAKRIAEGMTQGFVGHLLRGDVEGAGRYFAEHPLYSALEVSGAESVVGRGAGATMRSGLLGDTAKAAASMRRAPLTDAYGRTVREQRYPADVLRKGVIVARERASARRGVDPHRTTDARLMPSGQRHQSIANVDEFIAKVENLRRMGRQDANQRVRGMNPTRGRNPVTRALDRALPTTPGRALEKLGVARAAAALTRPERDVLHAVVEGRVDLRTLADDLVAERNRLDEVYRRERTRMDAASRGENRQQVRAIDRVLRSRKALANVRGLADADARYRQAADSITEQLIDLGLLDEDQALIARIRPYAVAKMGGHVDDAGRLVDDAGEPLTPERILINMEQNDVALPAFVSHRRDTRGARAFYVNFLRRRQTADPHRRTGRATERGAHASDFTSLGEQHIHAQGIVDAVHAFDGFVHQFGLKGRDGAMFTWEEAQRLAADPTSLAALDSHGNRIPGYSDLVPVRVIPARYSDATREAIAGTQDAHRLPDVDSLVEQRLVEAQLRPDAADRHVRNVVLVPADELRRFGEHQLTDSTTAARAGQALTSTFRSTVLPFSTKWLFGNVTEAALRLAVNGAGPNSYRIGRRLVRELEQADAHAARELRARTLGGTFFGGMERQEIHRDVSSFQGTKLEVPAAALGAAARTIVIKQGIGALHLFRDGVFAFNKWFEQQAQTAALGKEARQVMQEMTGSWSEATRAAEPAFADLVRGLTETEAQVRFARQLDEVLGKYSRFSPSLRKITQSAMPFLPWYLNSLRFVMWTLPAKHPIKTALLARVADTFQADFDAQHRDLPPGDLQAGVVLKDGGVLPLARFTPFGAFTNLPEGVVDPLLPQISTVWQALQGRSWTGANLRTPEGEASRGERLPIAVNAFFESIIPGLSIGRRLREHGETPFDNSTIFAPKTRAGSAHGSAADRILNPLRPTYLTGTAPPVLLDGAPGGGGRAPGGAGRAPGGGGSAPGSNGRAP